MQAYGLEILKASGLRFSSQVSQWIKITGHNVKWDHFDILASGKTDYHYKIKETLFIYELKPALNVNVGSEKLLLYRNVFYYYCRSSLSRFQTPIVVI